MTGLGGGAPAMAEEATGTETARRVVIRAVGLMLIAGFVSSLMHLGVRIVSPDLPTMMIVFLRALFSMLCTLPFVLGSGQVAWRTRRPGLQMLRASIGVLSLSTWYYALGYMPLAEAGALSFTTALFVTVGAALYFREQVGLARAGAVVVGFIGAIVVLRPGAGIITWAAIAALGSSALWAVSLLMAKQLTKFDSSLTVAFYQPLLIAPLALIGALPVWTWPDRRALLVLIGMGVIASVGNWAYIHALKIADASVVMPADYVRLLWMATWGFVLFTEIPHATTWLGAALIIAAAFFITWHEARRPGQPQTQSDRRS